MSAVALLFICSKHVFSMALDKYRKLHERECIL